MKKFKKLGLIALTTFVMIIMTGCKDSNSIIGKWAYYDGKNVKDDVYYEFGKDNKGTYSFYKSSMNFTYEDKGNKVSIKYDGNTSASEFEYSIKGGVLTIKDSFGSDVLYKRK